MTPAFRQLLNRFAMPGFEHQLALADVLEDHDNWSLSPENATATFATGRTYPIQLLGTRSAATNTWLWAWANKSKGIPAQALEGAKKARQVGRKRSIGELEVDTLDLDHFDFDAHTLALVGTAVAGLPAYFKFPYKGGELYAAFGAGSIELPAPDLTRIAHVIEEVVSRFDLDARTAANAYLVDRGAQVHVDRGQVEASWSDGRRLTATFDEKGHLTGVSIPGGRTAPSAGAASQPSPPPA